MLDFEEATLLVAEAAEHLCVADLFGDIAAALSIDGIEAFDHIKRKSMLEAPHNNSDLALLLTFVRLFYGKDSTYVWHEAEGAPHEILQGKECEHGDPLMPALPWASTQL